MRINEFTALSAPPLLLTPYLPSHVATYHEWMQSPELLAATASEPLTLAEEHTMQQSWRRDGDKLTFIIHVVAEDGVGATVRREGMIGDVNVFLFRAEEDDEEGGEGAERERKGSYPRALIAELELMIAHPSQRGQGHGRAALELCIAYVLRHWSAIAREFERFEQERERQGETQGEMQGETQGEMQGETQGEMQGETQGETQLAYLRAKIQSTNAASVGLFENVGFTRTAAGENYFGEVELRMDGAEWIKRREREGTRTAVEVEMEVERGEE